jgi:tetratricopeptide (TPR) repeat protein
MRTVIFLGLVVLAATARAGLPDDQDEQVVRWEELATTTHKKAQQTNDTKLYEDAAGYYEKWLAKPGREHEDVMAFYYAELNFKLQRWEKAAEMYERSVAVNPSGKYAKEAAYAAMISRKNALGPEPPRDAGPSCPEGKQCAISPAEQRLLTAFDLYLKTVPQSPERPSVEYRKARLYYEHNHFAEAAPFFEQVRVGFPTHELATFSANLEMDCLANLKRWGELRALVDRIKKSPMFSDAATQQNVRDLEAQLKQKRK